MIIKRKLHVQYTLRIIHNIANAESCQKELPGDDHSSFKDLTKLCISYTFYREIYSKICSSFLE